VKLAHCRRSERSDQLETAGASMSSVVDLSDNGERRPPSCAGRAAFVRSGWLYGGCHAFGRSARVSAKVRVFGVREWDATAIRKAREPLFRKRVETDRGKLTFTSVTELDAPARRLIVRERHTLEANGRERSSDYQFVMRCWTPAELQSLLRLNGFGSVAHFGAYDPAVAPGATDRLVSVARNLGRCSPTKICSHRRRVRSCVAAAEIQTLTAEEVGASWCIARCSW
jgi:hypothetical protein